MKTYSVDWNPNDNIVIIDNTKTEEEADNLDNIVAMYCFNDKECRFVDNGTFWGKDYQDLENWKKAVERKIRRKIDWEALLKPDGIKEKSIIV